MIDIFHSIVLGIVQGLAEFLPISSSGHLVIVPWLLKWKEFGLSFDIALHFGTAIAIVIYFWQDWITIFAGAKKNLQFTIYNLQSIPNDQMKNGEMNDKWQMKNDQSLQGAEFPSNFLWQILVASIPAATLGFVLDKLAENYFHSNIIFIAINLIVFGILLYLVDKYAPTKQVPGKITYKQSFLVGLAQSISLIPGVSRSGITLTASRALGLEKEEAARFSFLLATPTVVGAFLLKAKDIGSHDLNLVFLLGVIFSTIFGFLAIKYLLRYLKRGNFAVFAWYRIALAILVLAVYFLRG